MNIWQVVKDGDLRLAALYRRHYSCYQYSDGRRDRPTYRNRNLVLGPGYKVPLLTPCGQAAFAWRKFYDRSGQQGINCAFFRNESDHLSSWLILQAEELAWARWPGERLYTYVDVNAVESVNPGYCFLCAGWRRCGHTKRRGLLILDKMTR
jgi:hypothetical protein